MNVGFPTPFYGELSGALCTQQTGSSGRRRMDNYLPRFTLPMKTARKQGTRKDRRLALAQTTTSFGTSVIMIPFKLCSFICVVGTLPASLSSVQTGGRAEAAVRQSTNISCFYLCLNFVMEALSLSPFLTSGGRLRTSSVGQD